MSGRGISISIKKAMPAPETKGWESMEPPCPTETTKFGKAMYDYGILLLMASVTLLGVGGVAILKALSILWS